jgi:hypothetical protein
MAAQAFEHGPGFGVISGFAKDIWSIDDGGIRCQNDLVRIRVDSTGFGFG